VIKNKISVKPYHFDRGKVYYPLVMNYIHSIHGFIDLASRGLINKLAELKISKSEDEIKDVIESLDILDANVKKQFKEIDKSAPLIFKQTFIKYDGKEINLDINEIADEIFKEGVYLTSTLNNSACILLISAFERTRDWDDQNDDIWNFFYHCRNAAAHNNSFKIEKNRFPAKWRDLEITKELNGNRLFKENEYNGFLNFGDPIALLWDIEQNYHSMKLE
jgi:hypothetical protein